MVTKVIIQYLLIHITLKKNYFFLLSAPPYYVRYPMTSFIFSFVLLLQLASLLLGISISFFIFSPLFFVLCILCAVFHLSPSPPPLL
jgi:hypothetical protein